MSANDLDVVMTVPNRPDIKVTCRLDATVAGFDGLKSVYRLLEPALQCEWCNYVEDVPLDEVYTSSPLYGPLNAQLRRKEPLTDVATINFVRSFSHFISRNTGQDLPDMVYRGVALSEPSFKVGEILTWLAFTSTTSSLGLALNYAQDGGDVSKTRVVFKINLINERSYGVVAVQTSSTQKHNFEYLISPGSSFAVQSVQWTTSGKNKILYVQLELVALVEIDYLACSVCEYVDEDSSSSSDNLDIDALEDALDGFSVSPSQEAAPSIPQSNPLPSSVFHKPSKPYVPYSQLAGWVADSSSLLHLREGCYNAFTAISKKDAKGSSLCNACSSSSPSRKLTRCVWLVSDNSRTYHRTKGCYNAYVKSFENQVSGLKPCKICAGRY